MIKTYLLWGTVVFFASFFMSLAAKASHQIIVPNGPTTCTTWCPAPNNCTTRCR